MAGQAIGLSSSGRKLRLPVLVQGRAQQHSPATLMQKGVAWPGAVLGRWGVPVAHCHAACARQGRDPRSRPSTDGLPGLNDDEGEEKNIYNQG